MRLAYVVLSAAWLPSLAAGQPLAGERSPRQRELTLVAGEEAVSELYVAGRRPTALEFELPIRKEAIHLSGVARGLPPPQVNGENLVLFPLADIPPEEHPVLTVGLVTGPLMRFALRSRPDMIDFHVKVTRSQPPGTQQCRADADAAALAQCQQREKVAGLSATMETLLQAELASTTTPIPWAWTRGRFTSSDGPVVLKRKVPARPRDINPHVPEALDAVAMKLLAKQPARRPQTALELARELEDLVVRVDASWDSPLKVPAWAPEEGEETMQDDTTPALRSRWSARLRKAWRAGGAWLLGVSLAGLVLLGALVAGQRLAQDTLPEPQPQPLDQAAPAEPHGAPSVPPPAPAEPPAPVPVTTASAPLGKKGQPMKSDTRSRESRRRPPGNPPASAAGRFVVPPAITALCAAAVTACVTPGPLPAVPSREALQCPRQPSHRLGIKAATPGQRFPYFGDVRNVPGGPTADCANNPDRPCWIQVGPTPKMEAGGYREDKSSPWIIPPPDYPNPDHQAFGETRVIGDRLYVVVTRLELYDGRVVPLCALAYPAMFGDPNRPYFEVLKRDGKRVLVNSWMDEFRLHPLEDF